MFEGKTLLISGGTGSFGSTVLRLLIDQPFAEIRIFSRDEKKQEDQRLHYRDKRLRYYIGDVRDHRAIANAVSGVDYIFHAAALKQVPSCEFHPMEAVKTNVIGTDNVLDFFANTLDCDAHPYFDQLRGVRVSAHFFVRRTGECVQFAPCEARAWHAGASAFFGRTRCNDFSVGIEIEGTDDLPFTPEQYVATAALVRAICKAYPIAAIAGHSDIAPGRKTDPGPCFDWAHLRTLGGFDAALFPYQRAL